MPVLILHTSDLHLDSQVPARQRGLERVLACAREHEVDLLVVAGDLFHSPLEAERLRPRLRGLFSGNPFQVIIIAGNHDRAAFQSGEYLGSDVTVLGVDAVGWVDFPSCRVVCLPPSDRSFLEMVPELQQARRPGVRNLLVLHCTLLAPFLRLEDFGPEEHARYLPVTLSMLDATGYDYVLAGHFHSRFDVRRGNRCVFVYPGSPVAITRREQGKRMVNLLDLERGPTGLYLDTFYYHTINVELTPGREAEVLEVQLPSALDALRDEDVEVELVVSGLISWPEDRFSRTLRRLLDGRRNVRLREQYQSVSVAIEDPLYARICRRLASEDCSPDERAALEAEILRALAAYRLRRF